MKSAQGETGVALSGPFQSNGERKPRVSIGSSGSTACCRADRRRRDLERRRRLHSEVDGGETYQARKEKTRSSAPWAPAARESADLASPDGKMQGLVPAERRAVRRLAQRRGPSRASRASWEPLEALKDMQAMGREPGASASKA